MAIATSLSEADAGSEEVRFATGERGAAAREIVRKTAETATAEVSLALWFLLDYEERTRLWDWEIGNPRVKQVRSAARRFKSTAERFIEK